MSDKITVLIVDDSAYNRQTIKAILSKDDDIEVIGIATDGVDAMTKAMRLKPDLITLDFEMPEMDGLSFLRWLMHEMPTPVIMVSSHSDTNVAIKALEFGAVDFVLKPTQRASVELKNIEIDLLAKVKGIKSLDIKMVSKNIKLLEARKKKHKALDDAVSNIDVVAIGSSTGGPAALQLILTELPSDFPSAIIISQHMPKGFTGPLAVRLNKICGLSISEARDGIYLKPENVYICPGGTHMKFIKDIDGVKIKIIESTEEDKYTPSVDIMMNSIAEFYTDRMLGVILTGMGYDGREGLGKMKRRGGHTMAESEETAIVFGMPNEAIKANAVEHILPVNLIAAELRAIVMGERRR